MRGTIIAVCSSVQKGTPKQPLEQGGVLLRGHGLQGDAHAGSWHRQLSLLAEEDIEQMRQTGLTLGAGDFAENLVTQGVPLLSLAIGRRFRVGENAVLQVTQHGKKCHSRCRIYQHAGDCIMPRRGIFARVIRSGEVKPGDRIETDSALDQYRYAVITLSDRASSGTYQDESGPAVQQAVENAIGGVKVAQLVIPDDKERLTKELIRLADEEVVDLILTTGGTGLSPRDITPEATRAAIDREVPGIAEAIRAGGMAHTPRAMLSRGISGMRGQTLIVNLSGSPKAVKEQMEIVGPVLGHALQMATGIPADCGKEG